MKKWTFALLSCALSAVWATGCDEDNPSGRRILCIPECEEGFVCEEGVCVGPSLDSGFWELDATPPKEDATPPEEDATPPEEDATPPEEDAAPPEEDATPPEEDAAPPEEDAAPPEEDAAPPEEWTHPWPQALCESNDDCAEGERCQVGGCVAPAPVAEYGFGGQWGYVTQMHVPKGDETPCCFDLDGDGRIDNDLPALSDMWALQGLAGSSAVDILNRLLLDGRLALLLELRSDDSGQTTISVVTGTNDLDGDGENDQTKAERAAGEGVYRLDRAAYGSHGPHALAPLTATSEESGTLFSAQGNISAPLQVQRGCPAQWDRAPSLAEDILCPGEQQVTVKLSQARFEFDYEIPESGGLRSIDTQRESGETVGGLRVGGYMHIDSMVQAVNHGYADRCGCAGVTVEQPLLRTVTSENRLLVECAQDFSTGALDNCPPTQRTCNAIPLICRQAGLLSFIASVDSDGDGVKDAFPVGMSVSVAPATIDLEQPWRAPSENCTDGVDNSGNGLIDCDDPACAQNRACR